jgi:mannose-6-phosphate isomerase-like protein (cupin superfamily)
MKKNQTIANNATGETLTMLVSEEEKDNACQLYEVHLPPRRPSPPLHFHVDFTETFTVVRGKLDMYVGRNQEHVVLEPSQQLTAQLRQPRFANDRDEDVIFRVETRPAGGVVKAFQLAYGIANDGGAARDGLPRNLLVRLLFIKISQGYLAGIPLLLQKAVLNIAALMAKVTGVEKKLRAYYE